MKGKMDLIYYYLKDIQNFERLTKEEEYSLVKSAQSGCQESRESLINANLRLVITVAKKHVRNGMALMDLVSEGNIGLMGAIDKFDVKKEVRFSTYAVWWVRQSIMKAIINKSRDIRLPSYKYDQLNKIKKFTMQYKLENGKNPTMEEIVEETGVKLKQVRRLEDDFKDSVSLNKQVGEGLDLEEVISISDESISEDSIIDTLGRSEVVEILKILKPREQLILKLRYGIGYDRSYTLAEIGEVLNLTKERVRQIEKKTLDKLKKRCSQELKLYLDDLS